MPEDGKNNEVDRKKNCSVSKLAKLWGLNADTVRRVFIGEPDVVTLHNIGGGRSRPPPRQSSV